MDQQIRQVLEKDGIIIIPGVLNSEECESMYKGMWDMFEHVTSEWDTPVLRSDPSTWKNLKYLQPNNGMMYQMFGLSHSSHLWDIRSNEKIVKIWADFWNVKPEDLLVSFDGFSWLPPHEEIYRVESKSDQSESRSDQSESKSDQSESKSDQSEPKSTHWFHLDQTVLKTELEGVQGWVTGMDVNPGDATLIYYDQSHKMIKQFVEEFGVRTESDWFLLNEEENNFFKSRCEIKEVTCPAGSLVIWDSRLVHCNKEPDLTRSVPNYRCISYLCYMPKSMSDQETINKRVVAFGDMRTSNHYANRATFFPKLPREWVPRYTLEDIITPIPNPEIDDLARSLIGIDS